jgi:hypothetical protein
MARAPQVGGEALTAVMPVGAGDDDGTGPIEALGQHFSLSGIRQSRPGEPSGCLVDQLPPTHVDEDRGLGSEEGVEQIMGLDEERRAHGRPQEVACGTWARA